jgi:hypothetical protein
MRLRTARVFGGALAILLAATMVHAQDTPEERQPGTEDASSLRDGRYGTGTRETGLFGRHRTSNEDGQFLDASLSGYDAYDTFIPLGAGAASSSTRRGTYPGADGILTYDLHSDKILIQAKSMTGARYYPQLVRRTAVSEMASGGATWNVTRSFSVSGFQTYSHRPWFSFVPGGAITNAADQAVQTSIEPLDQTVGNTSGYMEASRVSATETLGRWSFTGHYQFNRSAFNDAALDLRVQDMGGTIRRNLTQYMSLRAGYSYRRQTDIGVATLKPRIHDIDLGFDYKRPLSFSRNTTVGASVGSSMIDPVNAPGAVPLVSQNPQGNLLQGNVLRLVGRGSVLHDFGRSWMADLEYSRGLNYLEGFAEPVLSQTTVVSTSGYFTRRLGLDVFVAYTVADRTAFAQRAFDTGAASTRLKFALGRHFQAYSEYVYYRYNFVGGSAALSAFETRIAHHVVKFGGTIWIPLIGRDNAPSKGSRTR